VADGLRSVSRSLTLAPDLGKLAEARRFVAEAACEARFDEERIFDITVASSEATANAIEHAPIKGHVEITIFLYDDRLEIQIEGPGEFQTPDRLKERAPRGLGLPLMAKLADHLALYSGPRGGTLVSLTFYRPGQEQEVEEEPLPPSLREIIEENELFLAITENAPVGIFVLDSDLRYRWTNRAYRDFLDEPYRSGDLTGLRIQDVVPAAKGAGLLLALEEASKSGRPRPREEYELSGGPSGSRWWRRNVVPLRSDKPGPPYDVLVVISEETQRKDAEQALRESEAKLSELIQHAPAGIYEIDFRTRRLTSVNQAMSRMSGYSREELLNMDPLDLLASDEDRVRFQARIKTWLAGEAPDKNVEFNVRTKDCAIIHTVLDVTFTKDDKDNPLGASVIAYDVTERKRAEDALRESRGALMAALSSMADAVFISDAQGQFMEFNDAFVKYHRFRDRGDCSKNISDCADLLDVWFTATGEPAAPDMWAVPRALRGETANGFEYTLRRRDTGETWTGSYNFAPIHDESGAIVGSVVTARDITERKRAEEELRESETRYSSLFNNQINGIAHCRIITDENGLPVDYWILRINAAYERIIGMKKEDIEGRRVTEVFADIKDYAFDYIGVYGKVALEGGEIKFEEFFEATGQYLEIYAYSPLPGEFAALFTDVTERKRAEEALRESEERMRHIAQAGHIGFVEWNVAKDTGYWSPEHYELFGFKQGSPVSWERWLQGVYPEDRERVMENASRLLDGARSEGQMEGHRDEYRFIRPDGNVVWIEASMSVDMVGAEPIIRGWVRDVTHRKQTEEALRKSEERLRRSQNIAHLGSWELDLETNELVWSDEVYRIFGLQPQEFGATYEVFLERVHPEDRGAVHAVYSGSLREGVDSYEIEHRVVRKNTDEVRWVQERCEHLRNSDGRIIRSMGMVLDITERRQAEEERELLFAEQQALAERLAATNRELESQAEELAASEEELLAQNEELRASQYNRSLLEAALDPLVTIGPDGKITDVNEATMKITGRERDELIGTDFSDYFTDPEGARRGYREVFAKGSVTDYPLTIRDLSGRLTDVLYNASVYKDQDGRVLGVFAAARDITALRELEEQRSISTKLQEALFDQPQEFSGVGFGHLYRSATKEALIGGDFYDVIELKNGRLAVLIGDVSGHGVKAARIATLAKDVVHAFSHQFTHTQVVLKKTNDLLVEKRISGFVTLFLGILDLDTGLLTCSSAGHPNVLLRTAGGRVELLEAASAPLGVFPGHSWKESQVQLEKNDLLLLYTDGAIEARRNGEFFGQERLVEALESCSDPSPEFLPQALLDEVLSFSAGELTDDVAMLALSLKKDAGEKRSERGWRQEKLLG